MDNGLVLLEFPGGCFEEYEVLILVVVGNGLVWSWHLKSWRIEYGLNPYCSGQWSRTMLTGKSTLLQVQS